MGAKNGSLRNISSQKVLLKDYPHSTSAKLFGAFPISPVWPILISTKADPLAILEASLTSLKYAFYQALGCAVFCILGDGSPQVTILSSAGAGFVGGAIFTIPFLILLLVDDHAYEEFGSFGQQLLKEMMYSAAAGGVGMSVIDGWSAHGVVGSIVRGLVGPLVSFAFLYAMLKLFLGAICMVY